MNFKLALRAAHSDDCAFVFKTRNSSSSVKNSLSSNPISWEQHSLWFENAIKNKNIIFYIFSVENSAEKDLVGYFRVDESSKVSVALDENYIGEGLGSKVIEMGSVEAVKNKSSSHLLAEIKKTNMASIKSFEKAGYKYQTSFDKNNERIDVYQFSI